MKKFRIMRGKPGLFQFYPDLPGYMSKPGANSGEKLIFGGNIHGCLKRVGDNWELLLEGDGETTLYPGE
jgi:hypothetical protein